MRCSGAASRTRTWAPTFTPSGSLRNSAAPTCCGSWKSSPPAAPSPSLPRRPPEHRHHAVADPSADCGTVVTPLCLHPAVLSAAHITPRLIPRRHHWPGFAAARLARLSFVSDTYRQATAPLVMRSRTEVTKFFTGFDLASPGVVYLTQWRPILLEASFSHPGNGGTRWAYAGMGRKLGGLA